MGAGLNEGWFCGGRSDHGTALPCGCVLACRTPCKDFPMECGICPLMGEVAAVACRLMMGEVGEKESGPKREIQTALLAQPGGCMSARRAGASARVSTDTAGRACLP